MTTYRERRLARAERLNEWADKRDTKADAHRKAAADYIDKVPLGQPILVGHHSEGRHRRDQSRFVSNMDKSIENSNKADEMRQKADNIEAAAARAIYDDDPDAIERLQAKIERAERIRDSIRLFNVSCRKGSPDFTLLDEQMTDNYEDIKRFGMLGNNGQFPPYFASNLSGVLNKDKKRLARLRREAA